MIALKEYYLAATYLVAKPIETTFADCAKACINFIYLYLNKV